MTFYEVLLQVQHTQCDVAKDEIAYLDEPRREPMPAYRQIMQEAIDRCYVLGEVIDNLPVEIAEREI